VLRYIVGTVDYGLDYTRGDEISLVGYTDSEWAGCATDKKSTLGCCFWFGVRTCFLVQPKAKVSCFEFRRGRVHGGQSGQLRGHLAS
jgi:hypothetical protein